MNNEAGVIHLNPDVEVRVLPPGWDGWVGTNSGRRIDLYGTKPEEIDIEDIAGALSKNCRFTGQLSRWYSVAEHCIWVARLLPPHMRLIGLLHDAAEAYIADVASPVKRALGDVYRNIEDNIALAIGIRFGLGDQLVHLPQPVKDADRIMLMTERDALQAKPSNGWGPDYENCVRMPGFVRMFDNDSKARTAYLRAFDEYGGVR